MYDTHFHFVKLVSSGVYFYWSYDFNPIRFYCDTKVLLPRKNTKDKRVVNRYLSTDHVNILHTVSLPVDFKVKRQTFWSFF